MAAGYYRFPTIHHNTVVFVCEDDLWTVPTAGGIAHRLTSNLGQIVWPAFSPDGTQLAFTGNDEGYPEVYVIPAAGGPARRLTYLGATSLVAGWSRDGQSVIFASTTAQPFNGRYKLYTVDRAGGEPQLLPTGPATSISYGPDGGAVIARNTTDLARWKRYRGGLTGDIWVDPLGDGEWRRLITLPGNLAMPRWVGARIYFVSDHEGIGNLYSCLPTGEDLQRHTHHDKYYVRHPSSNAQHIVYYAGADLYLFDPETNQSRMIDIEFHSPQVQRQRKFVNTVRYLQSYDLHPQGRSVAITARGKAFTMSNWEGAVLSHGDEGSARCRLATWLHDGKRLVLVSDVSGEEALEIHHTASSTPAERLEGLDIGRPLNLIASPKQDLVALSNQRHELILVDLATKTMRVLDHSRYANIHGLAWSPDGRWIAYGFSNTQQTSVIKLCQIESGETWAATKPVLFDMNPSFDPEGKYLYFLSARDFDPVFDSMHFDLNFPRSIRPYLITLRADLASPFIPTPPTPDTPQSDAPSQEKPDTLPESTTERHQDQAEGATETSKPESERNKPIQIDREGISDRIVAFPVAIGLYRQIRGIKGKALFSSYPIEGRLHDPAIPSGAPAARGILEVYDFAERSRETLIEHITSFDLSLDAQTLIYRSGYHLRVLKAGEKPSEHRGYSRKSGWLDLDRVRIAVLPPQEWEQMYREAWRLQRDHFWTSDMSGIDWHAVYERYLPLLQRVASRSEFSDLMWEMQGELGTSHAYEMGGDYRRAPDYEQGFLGADLRYDPESESYVVTHVVRGDGWDQYASSPLSRPGVNVKPGDRLVAINQRRISRTLSPQELLLNQADTGVLLTFAADGAEERTVTVRTLANEMPARYREWVETNRERVHAATNGRIGYVHIPDMSPRGYAEFHRGYLAEVAREGLIVDVRFNGGGFVSQLILEKLSRQRLGYDVSRWSEPVPYPQESVMGPIVALTNERAGSDGDIFCHTFKLMNLGPLIGKRTWGGVIGINPLDTLMDGGMTTQPEFSFWFNDVSWQVENYGTDPTIEVDIRPQDDVAGDDPQLERAIAEALHLLAENPPQLPDFSQRPRLGLPTLPKR
ncbi:MAG: PDZ domain-containing protein [Chloroflexales bacterium]|nr:PDZ domain-containing protein [Chloroflexales bacterium]